MFSKVFIKYVVFSTDFDKNLSECHVSIFTGGKHSMSNRKEGRKWRENTNQKAPDGFSRQRSHTRSLKKRKKMYENSHRPTKGKSADSRCNTIRETPQCVPWGIPLQQVRWIIETGHHSIPGQGDSLDSANAFDWALGARYYKNLRNQKRTFMKRVRERVHSHRSALKILS